MSYLYVLLTIVFTAYGQVVLKWRLGSIGALPEDPIKKLFALLSLYKDVWILSGFFSAFLASLFWMAAISKLNLSQAYPFMSLTFGVVFIASALFLNESISRNQIIGLFFIITGIIIASRNENWF